MVGLFIAAIAGAVIYASHAGPLILGDRCADGAVFWFAEGNVWRGARYRDTWALVFNPTAAAQTVRICILVDGADAHGQSYVVPARTRLPVNLAELTARYVTRAPDGTVVPLRAEFNFATEVHFETVGHAQLVGWDRAYEHPIPLPGTQGCQERGFHAPY